MHLIYLSSEIVRDGLEAVVGHLRFDGRSFQPLFAGLGFGWCCESLTEQESSEVGVTPVIAMGCYHVQVIVDTDSR